MKPTQIKKVSASEKVCALFYGHPGAGKTRLIGTMPRTLIIHPPTEHLDAIQDKTNVEEWTVNDWSDMEDAAEYLRHDAAGEHDWVWLDNISLFQDHGLDDVWEFVLSQKPHRKGWGMDKGEYGTNMERLSAWCRHAVATAKSGSFNLGITAHPAELYSPADEIDKVRPFVQGKNMSDKICGYMHMVGYLAVEGTGAKKQRVMYTEAGENFYAKDQFDAFPGHKIVNPTMPLIVAAIDKARGAIAPREVKRTPRRVMKRKV